MKITVFQTYSGGSSVYPLNLYMQVNKYRFKVIRAFCRATGTSTATAQAYWDFTGGNNQGNGFPLYLDAVSTTTDVTITASLGPANVGATTTYLLYYALDGPGAIAGKIRQVPSTSGTYISISLDIEPDPGMVIE